MTAGGRSALPLNRADLNSTQLVTSLTSVMATEADRQELQSRVSMLAIQFAVLLELRQQSLIDGPEKYEELVKKNF